MGGISRNSLCPCGSGLKYKHCCLGKVAKSGPPKALIGGLVVAGALGAGSGLVWDWNIGGIVGLLSSFGVIVGFTLKNAPDKSRDRSGSDSIQFGK